MIDREAIRHLSRAFVTALLASAVSIAVVDAIFWGVAKYEQVVSTSPFGFLVPDAALGLRHVTSRTYSAELRRNGRLIYLADYSYDAFGRRSTFTDGSIRRRAILFFGCSYVDGTGVNDGETIPSQVRLLTREYDVLNYGLGSSGPQQMLVQLRQRDFEREGVPDAENIGLYVFVDFHVQRAIGSMAVSSSFGGNFPFFELDHDDRLVSRGTFLTGRPVRSLVYRALHKSHVVRYGLSHRWDWPLSPSANDFRTTAAIIGESKAAFLQRFRRGRFVVILYPGTPRPSIRPWLSARGIEYLDLSELFDPTAQGLSIPGDGHPTPMANAILARRIAELLSL